MTRATGVLTRALHEVEAVVDWFRYRRRDTPGQGPFRVLPYRGHGTTERVYLRGRVLQGEPIPSASRHDSAWRNLLSTLRRLESDEVPAARLRASMGEAVQEVLADDEGYFQVCLQAGTPATRYEVWRAVSLELLDPVGENGPVRATGHVMVPPPQARFGVISDIDDTVVQTEATNLLRMLRLVFLTNAHTRLPFEGVAAFYRALHRGDAGDCTNPIFYVSSSPWNLYDLLHEVFEVHDIPAGPLFLKDYGLAREVLFNTGHHEHKLRAIDHILETHPDLPFVLLGDSGQQDPEIYREVVRRHPGRVRAVYIRDVVSTARDTEVEAIAREVRAAGVEMLLVRDTVAAALHAVAHGLINSAALPEIRGEQAADEAAPGPLESVFRGQRG
jgi:phosphatidate phosphatase APP1